jgi:hypothetical protein
VLSAPDYLFGVAELSLAAGAAAVGATRLRSRLLPGWSGPPAWLAAGVIAIAILIWVAELLGSFGALTEVAYFPACAATGLALRLLVPAPPPPTAAEGGAELRAPRAGSAARLATLAAVALVVAHWSIGTRLHLDEGMTGFDSTWYHGPFAALFAQTGSTFDLHLIAPDFLAWFYPANSELLHSVGILAFDRDIASPLLNLGWLGACMLAAWCVGRPYGAGPWSLVAVAVLLDSGVLADQAGEARNDVVGIFFVLAAAAVLVNGWTAAGRSLPSGALAVSGLAVGLAAGTKLSFLPLAGALLVGCVVLAAPGRRWRATAAFGGPLLAGGGYWYLRNLVQSGNPLPWVDSLGPLSLPAPDQELGGREQHSVADYLTDGAIWGDWFLPGLHDGLGLAWPLILGLALLPAVVVVGRRVDGLLRVLAASALVGLTAWILEPASAAGPDGTPTAFASNLRHLAPALALGFALLPALLGGRRWGRAPALLAVLLAALAFADASGAPWRSAYLGGAVAVGAAVGLGLVAAWWRPLTAPPRVVLALGATALLAVSVGAGYRVQRDYLRDRYAHPDFTAPGLNAAFEWARDVSGARIGTIATRQYPLFGTDLSNEVRYVGQPRSHGGFVEITQCRDWRQALNRADYDYVVASLDRVEPGGRAFAPQARWTAQPGVAEVVLRRPPTVVYRVHGDLVPRAC